MANVFIILSIICFGVGAFVGKVALKDAPPVYVYLLEASGTLIVACLVALYAFTFLKKEMFTALSDFNWMGLLFGILWGVGTVAFIVALKYKTASTVTPLSGIYPLVTVLLAVIFLGEALTIKIGMGIVMVVGAAFLLM